MKDEFRVLSEDKSRNTSAGEEADGLSNLGGMRFTGS